MSNPSEKNDIKSSFDFFMNIKKFSIEAILEIITKDPDYKTDFASVILGYYLPNIKFKKFHGRFSSPLVLGIMLNVPKGLLINRYDDACEWATDWLDKYETPEFNKDDFILDLAKTIDDGWDPVIINIIREIYSIRELINMESKLVDKNMIVSHELKKFI